MSNKEFEGFGGTSVGEMEVRKWSYPAIGYQASQGQLHDFGKNVDIDSVNFTPLAIRQCHEVTGRDGLTTRYPLYTRFDMMKEGKRKTRLQVLIVYEGELYIFGAKSWTARAAFVNPKDGKHHDSLFSSGVWIRLAEYIKLKSKSEGVQFTPLCFELGLKPATQSVQVGSGDETSGAYPLELSTPRPVFVGVERVNEYAAMFVDEDIAGWVKEWGAIEEQVEEDEELVNDDIPIGDTTDDELDVLF